MASIKEVLASIKEVLASIKEVVASIKEVLASIKEVLASIKEVLASIKEVLASIKEVLASIKEVLASIKEVLASIKEVVASIKEVLASIKEVLASIKEVLASLRGLQAEYCFVFLQNEKILFQKHINRRIKTLPYFIRLFLSSKMRGTLREEESLLEYHPKGRNFANKNNSDQRKERIKYSLDFFFIQIVPDLSGLQLLMPLLHENSTMR